MKEEHAAEAAGSSSAAEAGAAAEARTPARVVVLSPEGPREAEARALRQRWPNLRAWQQASQGGVDPHKWWCAGMRGLATELREVVNITGHLCDAGFGPL